MSKYKGHRYEWSKPYGNESSTQHRWEFRSLHGGIHFHVSIHPNKEYSPCAGLEFHYLKSPQNDDSAPDHVNCPITGGRCWHDGTSLYAKEKLWPIIETYLKSGNHEAIFKLLEAEADKLI